MKSIHTRQMKLDKRACPWLTRERMSDLARAGTAVVRELGYGELRQWFWCAQWPDKLPEDHLPLAYARLVDYSHGDPWSRGYRWVVPSCPFCMSHHVHGTEPIIPLNRPGKRHAPCGFGAYELFPDLDHDRTREGLRELHSPLCRRIS